MKATDQSKPAVALTFRQSAFAGKVLDVYREAKPPLHYSAIAEQPGLSLSAAYDMLRLSEQKGMVKSQYVTPKPGAGLSGEMSRGNGVPLSNMRGIDDNLRDALELKRGYRGMKAGSCVANWYGVPGFPQRPNIKT